MKITVKTKFPNYGRTIFYPVCAMAKAFARLIGHKCLTESQIEIIKSLGFEIEVQTPEL